jgi:hypothetical protein
MCMSSGSGIRFSRGRELEGKEYECEFTNINKIYFLNHSMQGDDDD